MVVYKCAECGIGNHFNSVIPEKFSAKGLQQDTVNTNSYIFFTILQLTQQY